MTIARFVAGAVLLVAACSSGGPQAVTHSSIVGGHPTGFLGPGTGPGAIDQTTTTEPCANACSPGIAPAAGSGASGVLTGYIEPCVGTARTGSVPYAAGIVAVSTVGAPRRAGFAEHDLVARNQRYRFVLPAGRYSVVAAYDERGVPASPPAEATVGAGATVELNVGTPCK